MQSLDAPASSLSLSQISSDISYGDTKRALLCTDIADCWLRNEYSILLTISKFEQAVMQWNAFLLFYGWTIYSGARLLLYYQNQIPQVLCQRSISISVYVLGKARHHKAARNCNTCSMAMVCNLLIVFSQTIQLKCKTGIWEPTHGGHFVICRLLVRSPF